jgi:general secretion pathway protein G
MSPQKAWNISRCSGLAFLAALILTVVLPKMGDVDGHGMRLKKALADLDALQQALSFYKKDHGDFPSQDAGLSALAGYIAHIPRDPWQGSYIYRRGEKSDGYLLYSAGVNGVDENGGGDDVTWPSKRYSCKDYGINCPTDYVNRIVAAVLLFGGVGGLIGFLSFGVVAIYSYVVQRALRPRH